MKPVELNLAALQGKEVDSALARGPGRRVNRTALFLLLGVAAFAVAYGQAPLYYSNQNQYFLHGLSQADEGLLRDDWLANTLDPTPVFSALVAVTARYLHPWAFYLYHGVLQATYAAALVGVFASLAGRALAARRWPLFLALLVLVHSAGARWLSSRLLGQDYPWYFQAGVAGQYVLGAMLQPSVFGVFLVAAVALFVRGHPYLAVLCVALGASVHSTYLLPGALLTLGFLATFVHEGRLLRALAVGAVALVLVLPITVYVLATFRPTNPEVFTETQNILVNVRIPHHARPDLWLDPIAALQVLWVAFALCLVRQNRLFLVLFIPFLLGTLLTVLQAATGSDTLALLFPWRISSVLVPVATAVVLSRLVALPVRALDGSQVRAVCGLGVVVLAGAAVWIVAAGQAFNLGDAERALDDFVRGDVKSGDLYFLPVRVPELAKITRGSFSSDFKAPAAKKSDVRVIPIDLQRFRLATGAPIYVDFKSIPYKDTEVLTWYFRLSTAERVQRDIGEGRLREALAELRLRKVTHLVWPAGNDLAGLEKIHGDQHYQVYRLPPDPK